MRVPTALFAWRPRSSRLPARRLHRLRQFGCEMRTPITPEGLKDMPNALLNRLRPLYDESPAPRTMAGSAGWPHGTHDTFGNVIPDLRSVVVHTTAGWPTRDKASDFVTRYTDQAHAAGHYGIGPSFYIAGCGTTYRVVDLPLITYHGEFVNGWSIGVEAGQLPRLDDHNRPFVNAWHELSNAPEHIPGAKLYAVGVNGQAAVAWWTTASYA